VRTAFPARGLPVTERDISFPRQKPRRIVLAASYRLMRFTRWVLGDRRALRLLLNANWILWRFSYETCMEHLGADFRNTTYCLSEEMLGRLIPPGGSVLDIGCGEGRLCQVASRYAGRVVGIDYDPHNIALATADNSQSNVEFRVADVTTALPNERFDLVLLVAVLEHIEDVDRLLGRIRGIARRLVVEVPDFESDPLNLVRRDLDCVWYTDADHVREYTRPILKQHLERNGWRPIEWETRGGMMLAVAELEEAH
jgi:SAM-dependent methyltransferase